MAGAACAAVLVVAGCTADDGAGDTAATDGPTTPTSDETSAGSSRDERLAAVRSAREVLGPAAVALVEAAGTARATTLAALGAEDDPTDRARAAASASETVATTIADAVSTAEEAVEEVEPTDDTAAAVALVTDAADAADALATTATDLLGRPAVVAADVEAITAIADGWDEPASRRVQVERLQGLGEEAEAYAEVLAQRATDSACWSTSEVVARAASNVAAASFELRDLARDFEGNAFDDRRDELRSSPLGEATDELAAAAEADAACLADDQLAVPDAIADLTEDLRAALTPADLTTG